jgi:hypothetical protein
MAFNTVHKMADLILLVLPIKVHPFVWYDVRVESLRIQKRDVGLHPEVTHGSSVTENKL